MTSKNHSTIASSEHAVTINLSPDDPLANATGPVTIPMTNDYLFRALLQRNNKVLKGLISSLLHLPIHKIVSVEILNPIELGKSIDEKNFILDVKVIYDQLSPGDDYTRIKPVRQIGFLDFTLFPEAPEFYATYKMLNEKTHALYSSKFVLSVVDLSRIDLATEEDKQYHIDYWASLFKATTWEEIKMLTKQNEYIKEASATIYQLSQEEAIRQQCEAREDYYRRQRTMQYYVDKATADLAAEKQRADEAEQRADNAEQRADNAEQRLSETQQRAEAAELKVAELMAELAALKKN